MAGNVCPTCNSTIDPARAPVALIRGSKVLTFCSSECADGDGKGKAKAKSEPKKADLRESQPEAEPKPASAKPTPAKPTSVEHDEESGAFSAVDVRPRSNRRRQIIALSAAIMAGGMIITIINAVSPSSPSDVSAAGKSSETSASSDPALPVGAAATRDSNGGDLGTVEDGQVGIDELPSAQLTPEQLYQRAEAILRELMASPSSRLTRIAAMALARTGDSAAIEHLSGLREEDNNNLVRIDAAYALARVGDERGKTLLLESLRHERRDVRVDAARRLVQLGADQGNKTLRRMLSLRTHRLGAAELLARRGNRDGIEVLLEVIEDKSSSDESRMRAQVALGRSGDTSVREQLVAILEDGRYMVGAADALAALGDSAAIAPLGQQLTIASLRVRAAVALRRLDAKVDLRSLADALDKSNDQARVSAAEAALVLTGPKKLAEHD